MYLSGFLYWTAEIWEEFDLLFRFVLFDYMSLALTNLSWWWLKDKQKEAKLQNGALNPASELNLWESETLKFSLSFGGNNRSSKPRRVKRKLQEQKIDREHDIVIVPSDGGCCISDSDSDASDWSIGWSEPHAPDFLSDDDDDESDGGFGVLVPCYGSNNRDAGEGMREFSEMKAMQQSAFLQIAKGIWSSGGNNLFKPADMYVQE